MDLEKFREEQLQAARKVVVKDDFKKIETIAGCDQAFTDHKIIAAIVVCTKDCKVIEEKYAVADSKMPYIPGFRYFREGAAIATAFAKLKKAPDVMMMTANGILHPLRFGMASHVGVALNVPTIGLAKYLLCGKKEEEGRIYFNNEIRGQEVITRGHSKPIYISPGHRISIETAVELVKEMARYPHKLPEPLHLAHRLANKVKKELTESKY
jgi:deoxyribonuclease V